MLEVITKLLILQADDQKVRQSKRDLEGLPKLRLAIKEKFLAAQAEYEKNTQGLKQNELDRKKLELEIQTKQGTIQRYKQQMLQTRKNDEYQALEKEIQTAEAGVSELETRELELMDQNDELQKEAAKSKSALDTIRTRLEAEAKQLVEREATTKAKIVELEARRPSLLEGIDPDVLSIYERVFAKKSDAAVVALSHDVCGGCHMKVTVTTSSKAKAGTEVVNCENCGRIVYQDW